MYKKIIINTILFVLGILSVYILLKDFEYKKDGNIDEEFVLPVVKESVVMIGSLVIPVEVADDEASRRLGLSFRESLKEDSGMLFVMSDRDVAGFWMKDMQFPLDIVWIDGDKIVNIHKNLPPGGSNPKEVYSSEYPVDHVLELNGGFADQKGLKVGDIVKYNTN